MRKGIVKNLNLIAGIQGIVLVIMFILGMMAFRLELEKEQAEYEAFMRDVMDWEYDVAGEESNVFEIFMRLNSCRFGKEYGAVMRLMDQYGANICETTTMNQILSWDQGTEGEQWLVQLDRFFSEADMDDLVSFYYDYERHRWDGDEKNGQMEMHKMQGYYNEIGDFVPVEIIFGDVDDQTKVLYTLSNEKAKEKITLNRLIWRYNDAIPGQENEDGPSVDERGNEYGTSWISFNETNRIYNEKARAKINSRDYSRLRGDFSQDNDVYEVRCRFRENALIQSYRVAFYADLDYITLHSDGFRKDLSMIVLFCQLAGIIIMICVLFVNKRRIRLQQMKNTFINAIAHEMKTPASVVKSGAECIREGIHPEKQAHYIELIEKEADHMSDLLNAMLVYTRVADAGYHLKKEPVSMEEICQGVWEHYQPGIKEKEILFEMDVQDPLCLKGDPALLEMVVDNFFSNALRHCPQGNTIRLTICQDSLSMYNKGSHIPDAEKDRIWEPLYQIDSARSGQSSSSGMGLAISAQILKLHHIKYGVRNVQGGVEFFIGL